LFTHEDPEEENMSKKVLIVFSLAVIASLLFAACERSASQPPVLASPTAAGTTNGTPQPTGMSLMQAWGTSTAVYVQTAVAMGLITAGPTSTTPQPSDTPNPFGTTSTPVVPPTGVATSAPLAGTTPIIVVATATPGRPATYTLHAREFPYCIARRFDVNPDNLLSLNGLSNGQIVQPGLTLSIPQTGSFPGTRALQAHPAQYSVAVNDTFYSIACTFGDVDPASIAAANGLSVTSPLVTGQILNIP
jgi:LysM repeat protein